MGTRNLTKAIYNGEPIIAQYGQWDGYPEGQGTTLFYTLQDPKTIEDFISKIPQIYYPTDEQLREISKPFEDGSMDGMMTFESGKSFGEKYPTLTRDTCGEIIRVIANYGDGQIPIVKDLDFENDALFCEAVYEVDLDKQTFTSKWGRNWKEDDPNYGEWTFVITLTFDEVRTMSVEDYHAKFQLPELV
jgi:hypothetical protein